jgi:1-deoxy-D-xylulose-5-phosphate synthase
VGGIDVLVPAGRRDVLLVAVGAMAHAGVEVAARLGEQGFGVTVVDPRWVRPVPVELVGLARSHRLVVTVEDGVRTGGVGDAVGKLLRDCDVSVPLRDIGIAPGWHPHGTRPEVLAAVGLTAQDIARRITGWISGLAAADPDRLADSVELVEAELGHPG